MRLLRLGDDGEFSLTKFVGNNIPRYAILSHTWGADNEEVTYKTLTDGTGKSKAGYAKIQFCGNQAAKDGLQYFWVDTCCIDKSSSAELSEAINSMFRWYYDAAKCYVYLSDVSIGDSVGSDLSLQRTWKAAFQRSTWFTRGWTLQELVASTSIEFFSAEGNRLGDKISLLQDIHDITKISIQALQGRPLSQFSVDERMSWARQRKTKREEDAAYSLLGIFNIHMPLIYGEGREKALIRLRKEIKESFEDKLSALPPMSSPEQLKRKRESFSIVPFSRGPDIVIPSTGLTVLHHICPWIHRPSPANLDLRDRRCQVSHQRGRQISRATFKNSKAQSVLYAAPGRLPHCYILAERPDSGHRP
ncbi:HET-domain-containing protein [Lepidopterella palustris CBS 459.81]|uniref:HET-domain-containing protein n=1 Tax=Lepidopterella palustris CBS 459.81 TaxID=1314670 RepID=A0A8E2J8N6_9PEZI|nr:HET-domain-containing protein [Lepidopterella palustris CBS 459.81]